MPAMTVPQRTTPAAGALAAEAVAPGVLQARALALLDAARAGAVRVAAFVHDRPALVLGSAQAARMVDEEACARDAVTVVRRGSGGGAVLCDASLLEVDVALPPGHRLAPADVTASYAWLGEAWCEALATLGVAARTAGVEEARALPPARAAAGRAACFASLVPHEVLTPDGRKLVGLAQRRRGGAVLLQCAAPCATRPAAVLRYLALPPPLAATCAAALERTASLADAGLGGDVDAVCGAIGAALARRLGV
jgi:lipoate-protein ligase A